MASRPKGSGNNQTLRRQPKETPKNLEWKPVSKSFDLFFTSIRQKVGSKTVKTVPPEFTELKNKIGQLRTLLKSLSEKSISLARSISALSNAELQNGEALKELASHLPQDDVLAPALIRFAEVEEEIASFGTTFKTHLENEFSKNLDGFINEEIVNFQEAKKLWKKALLEYNASKNNLDQAVSRKPEFLEPIRIFAAQIHFANARSNELQRFEYALEKVEDTLHSRDFKVLQYVVSYMKNLYEYVLNAYDSLYQLEDYLAQLKMYGLERRKDWITYNTSKKVEKKQLEEEEYLSRYDPLIDLLSAPDLALVNAVCVTAGSEREVILESLICILDAYKVTLSIVKLGISKEVEKTKDAGTLFRGNTMATKLMTAFTRMSGREYLMNTLKGPMETLAQDVSNGKTFEIDPDKAHGENIQENMANLKNAASTFLNAIISSLPHCPVPFRAMAHHLQEEVVKQYPEARHSSIGGFIFLRFFCPAILSPESSSPPLLTHVDNKLRRTLMFISKVIQNLASGVSFGSKEAYMADMNTFISENEERCKNFLQGLADKPETEEYESLCSLEVAFSKKLPNLHSKILKNLSKIGTTLIQYKNDDTIPILASILAELGENGIEIEHTSKKKEKKK